jgi:hypothetical protein
MANTLWQHSINKGIHVKQVQRDCLAIWCTKWGQNILVPIVPY